MRGQALHDRVASRDAVGKGRGPRRCDGGGGGGGGVGAFSTAGQLVVRQARARSDSAASFPPAALDSGTSAARALDMLITANACFPPVLDAVPVVAEAFIAAGGHARVASVANAVADVVVRDHHVRRLVPADLINQAVMLDLIAGARHGRVGGDVQRALLPCCDHDCCCGQKSQL